MMPGQQEIAFKAKLAALVLVALYAFCLFAIALVIYLFMPISMRERFAP